MRFVPSAFWLYMPAAALLLALPGPCCALTDSEMQTVREKRMGPRIVHTAAYDVRTTEVAPDGYTCKVAIASHPDPAAAKPAMTLEEYQRAEQEFATRINAETQADMQRLKRGELTAQQVQQRQLERLKAQSEWRDSVNARNSEAANNVRKIESRGMRLFLLHRPARMTDTIVPFAGELPSADFVSGLHVSLRVFLSTCDLNGQVLHIQVLHYYADAYQPAATVAQAKLEGSVFSSHYQFDGKVLKMLPEMSSRNGGGMSGERAQAGLTLAGYLPQAKIDRQLGALYRTDHASASKRQPGIVYRLDPYWRSYDSFDIQRRVFDGDFSLVDNGVNEEEQTFFATYVYFVRHHSERCGKSGMPITVLKYPYQRFVRAEYELDGTRVEHYEKAEHVFHIETRHAAKFDEMRTKISAHFAGRVLKMWGDTTQPPELQRYYAMESVPANIDRMLSTHACGSATLNQMNENLWRAAQGKPSMQAASVRFAGAEKESDPPTGP